MPNMLTLAPDVRMLEPDDGSRVWYSADAAGIVKDFMGLLCHTKGEWTGKPFRVQPWQDEAIDQFYGVLTEYEDLEPVRYRHYLYEEIPKKNGKSEFAAGLGLYHLLADGEGSPEVYLCAADKENAGIIYNAAKYMVENTPWLLALIKPVDSKKELRLRDGSGFIKVLSSESFSKHGYSPSCVIFDELHAQPKRDLWDVMTGAAGSGRRQPVWIVLTTAGDDPDRNSIGWEIHEQCRRYLAIRRGKPESETDQDDPLWLPIMYGIGVLTGDDPDKIAELDIYDEKIWRLCNPSLGVTVRLRTLRQEARAAKQSEAKERLFRWLRLNQWIATKTVGWVPLTIYDKTQWNQEREILKGKKCYGSVDLSSTTDLTAFGLLFPPQPGLDNWVFSPRAWIPLDDIESREKRDRVPYRDWIRAGFLEGCYGDMIDFSAVEDAIIAACQVYDVQMVGFDPYLSRTITARLQASGVPVCEIPQTMLSLSPPMKEIERLVRAHEMLHVHNTCARWCFGNVRCATDGNENIKPMKNRSTGRIDIAVSWIICMAVAMLTQAGPRTVSQAMEDGNFSL